MTPDQVEHARKVLRDLLPENGREAKRDEMTVAKLAKEIGKKDKNYISDFLTGRKNSLGAAEIILIEKALKIPAGTLLDPGKPDLVREPIAPLIADNDTGDRDALSAARRVQMRLLEPGEVVERDVTGGMGLGGNAPMVNVDGQAVDGVRAVWRLPVDYLRTELRSREPDVDFIPVDGDSMIPTLLPGDRVLINREQRGPSDALYAIHDGIGVAVKRLHIVKGSNPVQIRIISDNPLHGDPDVVLAEDLNVIGRVVCRVSRF